MNITVLLLIIIPLATAFLIPLIDLIQVKLRRFLVVLAGLGEFITALSIVINNITLIKDGEFFLVYHLGGWAPPFGINLAVDSLGMIFSVLVSLALFLIIIYSIGVIGHHEGKYYVLLFLVLGAMQGAVLTGDIFNLYVFIELLTVTSSPLVAFKRDQNGTEAAIKYLFYGITGGLVFFVGVILIYFNLGSLNMAEIAAHFTEIDLKMQLTIISIFLLSLLIKLGIFPFHFWLPKAHSACPSSISALLSGVMLKVYLYIFIRVFWIILDFSILQQVGLDKFIIYIALFSSLIGHVFAIQADDIKRMLAFSTIAHIGLIMAVVALNTEAGFYGGLLHVIAHLLMKSGLFLGIGYLLKYTLSNHISDLKGIGYKNSAVFISFFLLALGMIGIPPLIGFVSKWYMLLAFLELNNYFGAILVILGSLLAVIYYTRYIYYAYQQIELEQNEEIPEELTRPILSFFYKEKAVTLVIFIFTALVVLSGVFYRVFDPPITAAIEELLNPARYIHMVLGG